MINLVTHIYLIRLIHVSLGSKKTVLLFRDSRFEFLIFQYQF